MAWSRSLFLTLVCSLLCFRLVLAHPSRLVMACSLLLLLAAGVMAAMSIRRFHFDTQQRPVCTRRARGAVVVTASAVCITALALAWHFLLALLG